MIRELVSGYCGGQGFKVCGAYDTLAEVPLLAEAASVLLHIPGGSPPPAAEIAAFRRRQGSVRIIVLCSRLVHGEVSERLDGLVEAVIVDDSSLRALTGVLTVVQEGFRLSLPLGGQPAPELGDSSLPGAAGSAAPADAAPDETPGTRPAAARAALRTARPAALAAAGGGAENGAGGGPGRAPGGAGVLSLRERAVIQRLRNGASNKDIAKDLKIGESTVKVHLRSCYRKIGVRNRTQAAIWVAEHMPE